MTPNNIVNMAMVKGLDIIAVTDHNSAENVRAVIERGGYRDIMVIPGMEVETAEEVHVVCLFPDADAAEAMQSKVYAALPGRDNREDIFGEQLVLNAKDEEVGRVSQMLITATALSLEEVFSEARSLGGACIPAHVDRSSYSVLSNLGSIPEGLPVTTIELSAGCDRAAFLEEHPDLKQYRILTSSDAHYLWDISERENYFETEEEIKDLKQILMLFDRQAK